MKTYLFYSEWNHKLFHITQDYEYVKSNFDLLLATVDTKTWEESEYSKDYDKPIPEFIIDAIKDTLIQEIKNSSNAELESIRSSKFSKARLEHVKLNNSSLVEEYKNAIKDLVQHEDEMLEALEKLNTIEELFSFKLALKPGKDKWFENNHLSVANRSYSTNSTINLSDTTLNVSDILGSSDSEDEIKNESIGKRNSTNKKV